MFPILAGHCIISRKGIKHVEFFKFRQFREGSGPSGPSPWLRAYVRAPPLQGFLQKNNIKVQVL